MEGAQGQGSAPAPAQSDAADQQPQEQREQPQQHAAGPSAAAAGAPPAAADAPAAPAAPSAAAAPDAAPHAAANGAHAESSAAAPADAAPAAAGAPAEAMEVDAAADARGAAGGAAAAAAADGEAMDDGEEVDQEDEEEDDESGRGEDDEAAVVQLRARDDVPFVIPEDLLRRSGRERKTIARFETAEDEDEDERGGRRRGGKRGGGGARKRGSSGGAAASQPRRRRQIQDSASEESESSESTDYMHTGRKTQVRVKKRRRKGKKAADDRPMALGSRSSMRAVLAASAADSNEAGRAVNYAEDDDSLSDSGDVVEWTYAEEDEAEEEDKAERIMDDRPSGETDFTKKEFLVKWRGRAHLHNSWVAHADLVNTKSKYVLRNYIKARTEYLEWRTTADREDIDEVDLARELEREEQAEWVKVDRVLDDEEGEEGPRYFVKWQNLPYSESTWEEGADLAAFQEQIDAYMDDLQRSVIPKNPSYVREPRKGKVQFRKLTSLQPEFLTGGGELRDYQLKGLNWLAYSWCNDINGILADEMGLGKTVQTISFLAYLQWMHAVNGPFLVVVPLATLSNWVREFAKWASHLKVISYIGGAESRKMIQNFEFFSSGARGKPKRKFHVLVTTYELVIKDHEILRQFSWANLAVDEAHRLKNSSSLLYEILQMFDTASRLLITGTPIQNRMEELHALLFFLMPDKFHSLEEFQEKYAELKEEAQIQKLHEELRPHLLRRVKSEVEKSLPPKTERILRVGLSPMQRRYYAWILERNFSELNKGSRHKSTLLNIVAELKKTCNHPYLFDNAESESRESDALQGIIRNSSKLELLDKLLARLKADGHRVLIFSQMVRMLDILQDYLRLRRYSFQRLDGSTSADDRALRMDRFNAPDSKDFCFLLSTRAGGLGINLWTADTVIIFDSDWNPHNDSQAASRAHRIGQKKLVNVYRFVTGGTIEERILGRAKEKMVLEHLAIQAMDTSGRLEKKGTSTSKDSIDKNELANILKFGAEELFSETTGDGGDGAAAAPAKEMDLDEILSRAETAQDDSAGAASELMGAFQVANFSNPEIEEEEDGEFWTRVMPKDVQDRLKAEEEAPLFMPRSCTAAAQQLRGDVGKDKKKAEAEKEAEKAKKEAARKEKAAKAKKEKADNGPKKPWRPPASNVVVWTKGTFSLTQGEARDFYKSMRRFGTLQRLEEIAADANLQDKSMPCLEAFGVDLLTFCKANENWAPGKEQKEKDGGADEEKKAAGEEKKAAGEEKKAADAGEVKKEEGEEKKGDGDGGAKDGDEGEKDEKKRKRPERPTFASISLTPREFMQHIQDVTLLGQVVAKYEQPLNQLRFQHNQVPPVKFSKEWGVREDAGLMVGLAKHGHGNWDAVVADKDLPFQRWDMAGGPTKGLTSAAMSARTKTLLRLVRLEFGEAAPKKARVRKAAPKGVKASDAKAKATDAKPAKSAASEANGKAGPDAQAAPAAAPAAAAPASQPPKKRKVAPADGAPAGGDAANKKPKTDAGASAAAAQALLDKHIPDVSQTTTKFALLVGAEDKVRVKKTIKYLRELGKGIEAVPESAVEHKKLWKAVATVAFPGTKTGKELQAIFTKYKK